MVIMPLVFVANTFVASDRLPGPLRNFAEWNPVSALAQAVRQAFGNTGALPAPNAWPLRNAVLYTLLSVVAILIVFIPLSVREFNRAASR